MLPRRTWLDFGLASHVHLHAGAQSRHAANDDDGRAARQAHLSGARLAGLIQNLRSTVARLGSARNGVGRLREDGELRRAGGRRQGPRRGFVAAGTARARVWDLGANTGRFSRAAAEAGKRVIAFDIDSAAAERHFPGDVEAGRTACPAARRRYQPGRRCGWAGRERNSRSSNANADAILALALVHHLRSVGMCLLPMLVDLLWTPSGRW